jgi:predicted nucleic acid-binding protein
MPDSAGWDSCLFIEALQKTDQDRYDACEAMLARARSGDLQIVTSALTITEVNKLPDLAAMPEEQSQIILKFFENPYIFVRNVDRLTAEMAHEFTRVHGLMPMDAIHVATAIIARVPVLYTYDAAKKRRKGLLGHNLKIGNPPLRIERLADPAANTLFAKSAKPDDSEPKSGPELVSPAAPVSKPHRKVQI